MNILGLPVNFNVKSIDSGCCGMAGSFGYEKEHYENKAFAVNELNEILDLIPSSGSVSAQSAIVPHLAMRDSIFLFPTERGANYILLNVNDNTYPLNGDQLRSHIEDLKLNEEWKLISSGQNGIFLFEKAKH